MSDQRLIPLCVTLDGRLVSSETTCEWSGPYVLVIATTLPDPGLALEVHSIFVGHGACDLRDASLPGAYRAGAVHPDRQARAP